MAYASVMERTGSGSKEAACVRMPVRRFDGSTQRFVERPDAVIQEICLSLWVDGALCCETTCSPWDVEELVVGVLFMRGAIDRAEEIRRLEVDLEKGVASVLLAPPRAGEGARGGSPSFGSAFLPCVRKGCSGDDALAVRGQRPNPAARRPLAALQAHGRRAQRRAGRRTRRARMARRHRKAQRPRQAGWVVPLEQGGCGG